MLMFEEIAKKYNNSFALLYLKELKQHRVVKFQGMGAGTTGSWNASVVEVEGDKHPIKARAQGSFPLNEKHYNLSEIVISKPPLKQVFDYMGRTIVFSKAPNRQWHKGLTNSNSSFTDTLFDMLNSLSLPKNIKLRGLPTFRLSLESMYCMFIPDFAGSFTEAIEQINKEELVSRAINDTYFVSLYPSKDKPYLLFRYEFPLAFYNPETNLFTLTQEIYRQEVIDFCNRQGVFYDIK